MGQEVCDVKTSCTISFPHNKCNGKNGFPNGLKVGHKCNVINQRLKDEKAQPSAQQNGKNV
jgi:hypothetical protein